MILVKKRREVRRDCKSKQRTVVCGVQRSGI